MVIKVPNGGPTPTPMDNLRPAQPGAGTSASVPAQTAQLSAGLLLDRLQLENQQAVTARVAKVLDAQKGLTGDVILELRGRNLLVQSAVGDTRLEPGDWVKVMRAGNELRLLEKLAPAPEARIAQALAQRLPWQQRLDTGLTQLVATLTAGTQSETALPTPQPLPAKVQEAIQQLVSRLPASTSFSAAPTQSGSSLAAQVKTWIEESGLFAESRLTRAPDPALPDLKLALARIVATLLPQQGAGPEQFNRYTPLASHELVQAPLQFPNPLPTPPPAARAEPLNVGQMLRLLAGMLNRISVNQLHSHMLTSRAPADAPAPATWLLELPWVTPQQEPRVAQLRLEHFAAEDHDADDQRKASRVSEWRFSLALDLDDSGPVYFEVALRQAQVSAKIWAENQATLRQAQSELTNLRARLTDLGLDVVDLDCRRGSPQGATTKLEQRLVDTRA